MLAVSVRASADRREMAHDPLEAVVVRERKRQQMGRIVQCTPRGSSIRGSRTVYQKQNQGLVSLKRR